MRPAHDFDRALEFEPAGAPAMRGRTVPEYSNFTGQFGGITAATLLKAVLEQSDAAGVPVSQTVNYCAAIRAGSFDLSVTAIRKGRTLQHWRAEMVQNEVVVASALVALGARTSSWSHAPVSAPAAPARNHVPPLDTSGWTGWARQYEFCMIEGSTAHLRGQPPLTDPQSARSLLWLRHKVPRALDFPAIACMSDAFFVRLIQVRNIFPPMATVSLTTQFHCDATMLAAQGDRAILCDVNASVFFNNYHDQSAALWSDDGRLMASSHQTVWFAE